MLLYPTLYTTLLHIINESNMEITEHILGNVSIVISSLFGVAPMVFAFSGNARLLGIFCVCIIVFQSL